MTTESLLPINLHAAGIDIGSEKLFVSTRPAHVAAYESFTASLLLLREDLLAAGVRTVAMEATGVLWVPLYDILEEAGLEVCLVNGAHAKNVPGRKSDVLDCQWLQQLHSYGLLRPSFIPEETLRQLRAYVRLRDGHIASGARCINQMQKALELMNVKLHQVITQIHGTSGRAIIEAIIKGERDPERLADLCQQQILKNKRALVVKSLEGHYRAEHVFALQQGYACWQFYQEKIHECHEQIGALLEALTEQLPVPEKTRQPKPIRHHKPEVDDLHGKLMRLTGGRDPSQLCGLSDVTLLKLVSEVGTDMTKWPTEKHFTSWLGLAPGTHQSGKHRRRRGKRVTSRAGQIFRESAQSIARSKHLALGAFYRRKKGHRGPGIAMKATARKLAVLFYRLMRYGWDYVEQGVEAYEAQQREEQVRWLKKRAHRLGFAVVTAS